MRYITEKEMWFLIKNEDRLTIADFAKRFGCTGEEVYQYYSKVIATETYKNYILEKNGTTSERRRLSRGKKIFGIGEDTGYGERFNGKTSYGYSTFFNGDASDCKLVRYDRNANK